MKKAVSILQPLIESEKSENATSAGTGLAGYGERRCARHREKHRVRSHGLQRLRNH